MVAAVEGVSGSDKAGAGLEVGKNEQGAMPGVLKQEYIDEHRVAMSNTPSNHDRMPAESTRKTEADPRMNGSTTHTNGGGALPNGVSARPIDDTAIKNMETAVENMSKQLPPEIQHITFGYQNLAGMIERLAQVTHNNLDQVINELADMDAAPSNNISRGVNGAAGGLNAQTNVQKKEKLWKFAQDARIQLQKALVLSSWSRQAEAVGKAIDINIWLDGQKRALNDANWWIGDLKRSLGALRLPPPDIKTAIQTLSTGKADWLQDVSISNTKYTAGLQANPSQLGYLPPEELSPQRMLKALRTINALLRIRMNLHEKIPLPFRRYEIANGRATFKVPDEFELDVSIADEDTASQLYFIDFRFTFSPLSPDLPPGRIRNEIEGRTNAILRADGLPGCYEFLHNFVLTHKINILRNQVSEMVRKRWSENLRVEALHRSLVVQYWIHRPGPKNWIEIGIKRGRRKEPQKENDVEMPFIALRWHRHGKEVLDHDIKIDLANLSFEDILRDVIAAHTNEILSAFKAKVRKTPLYSQEAHSRRKHRLRKPLADLQDDDAKSQEPLTVKHRASRDPANSALNMDFTHTAALSLSQEPISGLFSASPPSTLHSRLEWELNKLPNPALAGYERIAACRCATAQEQIDICAKYLDWQIDKTFKPSQETVQRLFSKDVMRLGFFRLPYWSSRWVVVSAISMARDSWWLLEMNPYKAIANDLDPDLTYGRSFKEAWPIDIGSPIIAPSYHMLSRIANTGSIMVSQLLDIRQLNYSEKVFKQRSTARPPDSKVDVPYLALHKPAQVTSGSKARSAPPEEILQMFYMGLARGGADMIRLGVARFTVPIKGVSQLTSSTDSTLWFHADDGGVSFRLKAPLGDCIMDMYWDRLKQITRLTRYLKLMQRYQLQCTQVSLNSLAYAYTTDSELPLIAEVKFSDETGKPDISISFSGRNPHLRIQNCLSNVLNGKDGFGHLILLLRTTLPLLQAFDTVESSQHLATPEQKFTIITRSATWYGMKYSGITFDVSFRKRTEDHLWFTMAVRNAKQQTAAMATQIDKVSEAWRKMCQEAGQGWQGMQDGICANVSGVGDLVIRIDKLVKDTLRSDNGEKSDLQVAEVDKHGGGGESGLGSGPAKLQGKQPGATKDEALVLD